MANPDGRASNGRFAPGWKGGPDNPHAAQVARLRAALLEAVTPEDMADIIRVLIEQAKGGDVREAKEIIDRTLGKPQEADFIERLEALERSPDLVASPVTFALQHADQSRAHAPTTAHRNRTRLLSSIDWNLNCP